MTDFLAALGLVFVIEGLLYAAGPDAMKRMMTEMSTIPTIALRIGGLVAMLVGVLVVWLVRG